MDEVYWHSLKLFLGEYALPKNANYGFLVTLGLSFSFIGIALVLPLAACKPAVCIDVSWRKTLIGSIFAMICLAGILAVFFPSACSKTTHRSKRKNALTDDIKNFGLYNASINFKGHHPDCGNFAAHVLYVRGRIFCAACIGLLFGALLTLAGTVFYFFIEMPVFGMFGLWTVLVGQVGVALGLLQFKFKGSARSALNAFFVIACFLILVSVDTLAENVLFDLHLIGLIVFWLFARILTSQWDHLRICKACSFHCELRKG